MSDSISVSIPVDLEQFINEQVATGAYTNADAVVREALERLRGTSRSSQIEALRREIQVGIEQADRGECTPLDIEDVKQAARATWSQQQESQ